MEQHEECPKCHYVRQPHDPAPAWQCPRCGVAYGKFVGDRPTSSGSIPETSGPDKTGKRGSRFKIIRIVLLGAILIVIGADAWLTKLRTASWDHPLRVVVYPINGDGSEAAAHYIAQLTAAQFDAVALTMKQQASRYGVASDEPLTIALAQPVAETPPPAPRNGNIIGIMWWSLKLRLWANGADRYPGPAPEVRAFTLYYDPKTHPVLEHSTGLEKGMIGIIKLFASPQMAEQNNIVMLHELLHTLGATDEYDLRSDQPIYPDGYAEPDLQPLLPQKKAEIMAGRIPLSETRAVMPNGLADVVVGAKTAREIGWIK